MAIIAYTGVMGSGKTYEAVKSAAMAALKAGRRVVTNISGFNYEAIRDYLGPLDGDLLQPEKVLVVPSSRVTEPHFFYDPDVEADSVVKPGDLALLDEVWAFWGREVKLSPEHQKFFRMHRHYTELGTGMSCDLVLMIQDLTSLHRFIAGVLESSFKFTKMKSLGLTSRYRVEVYEGNKQRKATLVSASVNKYDKRIFPLYTSYDGGHGKERTVDDRQNLLRNPWFLSVAIVSTLALIAGAWWFVGWVQKMRTGGGAKNTVPATQVGSPVGAAATSVFFFIMMAALIDVVAGFTIGIRVARRDLDNAAARTEALHLDGPVVIGRACRVAELAGFVVPPGQHGAVLFHGKAVRPARRDRDDAAAGTEPDHFLRCGSLVALAVPELAGRAVPPRPHRPVGFEDERLRLSDFDIDDAAALAEPLYGRG